LQSSSSPSSSASTEPGSTTASQGTPRSCRARARDRQAVRKPNRSDRAARSRETQVRVGQCRLLILDFGSSAWDARAVVSREPASDRWSSTGCGVFDAAAPRCAALDAPALDPAERRVVQARVARYSRECGCAFGGACMVAALAAAGILLALEPDFTFA